MSNLKIYTFNGESGDKYYWTEKLNMTGWRSFVARVSRHNQDPVNYPVTLVFTPLRRKSHRNIEGKLDNYLENEGGCWVWQGNQSDDGYGRVRIEGKKRRAHIVSFEYAFGPVPEGLMVCHECGNSLCINPSHLYAGTYSDNYADMVRHGTRNTPRGQDAPKAKLTEAQVLEIRSDHRSTRVIAEIYGMGKSTIQQIKAGEIWTHLKL